MSKKKQISRNVIYFLVALIAVFVVYTVFLVLGTSKKTEPVKNLVNQEERIKKLPERKVADLIQNSKSGGELTAMLSDQSTPEELEQAITSLPEGKSFSFSIYSKDEGMIEVLRIDRDKEGIKASLKDEELIDELLGNKTSFNFIQEVQAEENWDSELASLSSSSLTLEEQVSGLRALLIKIISLAKNRDRGYWPIISVFDTPKPTVPSTISSSDYVNRCVASGGKWNAFAGTSGSTLKSAVCSYSSDSSVISKLNPLNNSTSYNGSNCVCPTGECLNIENVSERGRYDSSGYSTIFELRGYCSGGATVVNPPTGSNNCKTSGGTWVESGDSTVKYSYCSCPEGYRLRGERCVQRGWPNPWPKPYPNTNCQTGQINLGKFLGANSCFSVDTLKSNCSVSNGSWVDYGYDKTVSTAISNPPSHFCGRIESAFLKQENCSNDGSCTATAYPYLGCVCPFDSCLNAEGKCVPDSYNDDGDVTKQTSCTNSGGTWKQFANKYNALRVNCVNDGEIPYVSLWDPVYACDCPANKCLSTEGKCVDGTSDLPACENSGGIWREALDAPQYSYCQCPGDSEASLAPHARINFPRTCYQTNETDCGSDKTCFYNQVSRSKKTKLTLIEVNYFDGYRTEETSEIQATPKSTGSFQTEIKMTVKNLDKISENSPRAMSSGVVSDETLHACPALANNFSQLEGKTATCTVYSSQQARILVESGLSESNINRYGCSGDLLTKIKEICGTYPPMTVKKPAVYLYPEKEIEAKVSLKINGEVIKSEPVYPAEGWKVKASPNGLIDGKYDYLFYENTLNKIDLPKEGWVVEYKNLNSWFDETLPNLGLNAKEKSQFKEYWLAELKPSNFYEIKLLSDEFLAENMKLQVSPQPKTVIRRNFYFKPLQEKIELPEPRIFTPERAGFTVLEWGGLVDEK